MKIITFISCLLLVAKGYGQTPYGLFYQRAKGEYLNLVTNPETNTVDTMHLVLNGTAFKIFRTGAWNGVEVVGSWKQKKGVLVFTNKYPSETFLNVKITRVPDSCTGLLPPIVDNQGQNSSVFFLDANHYPFDNKDVIPYAELDSLKHRMRICAAGVQLCTAIFSIPYKDCYQLTVDVDVDLSNYNSSLKVAYFRKQKNRLILIKAEASGPMPD